jgi:hypothetical protein
MNLHAIILGAISFVGPARTPIMVADTMSNIRCPASDTGTTVHRLLRTFMHSMAYTPRNHSSTVAQVLPASSALYAVCIFPASSSNLQ